MPSFTLSKSQTGLIIIDMQERMFGAVDRSYETLQTILGVIRGCQILSLPLVITEQYPQGLGKTIEPIQEMLGEFYQPHIKSTFSCMDDEATSQYLINLPVQQWILIGIEAHVCVLQTAKGLLQAGKQVTVLNDAIASRSIFDYSTAIAEMRDAGIRISCAETVLFELVKDSQSPEFKLISQLVKSRCRC